MCAVPRPIPLSVCGLRFVIAPGGDRNGTGGRIGRQNVVPQLSTR